MAHPPTLRLLRGVSLWSFALFAPRLLRLLVVPLAVRAVGLEVYGTFVVLVMVCPFVQVAAELGTGTAALRLAPEEASRADRDAVFSTMLVGRLVLAFSVGGALFLARGQLARLLSPQAGDTRTMALVAATAVAGSVMAAFSDRLRGEERHGTLAGLAVGRLLLEGVLTLSLVVFVKGGLLGLLLARTLSDVAGLLALSWLGRSVLSSRPRLVHLGALVRIGAPIAALYLLMNLRELDRLLVRMRLGIEDVGRYDLALRIVGPVALANVALAMVLEPHVYRTHRSPKAKPAIEHFLRGYVVCFGTVAFAAAMGAPEVFPFLAPGSHAGAALIAPALVFSFVADGVLRLAGLPAELAKRTAVWAVSSAVQLAVALPLTWWLLPRFGLLAAGGALLLGTMTATVVCFLWARRLWPLSLRVFRALGLIALGAATATTLLGLLGGRIAPVPARIVATLAFAACAWVVMGFDLRAVRRLVLAEPTGPE